MAQRVEFFVLYEDEAPAACGGVQFFGDPKGADESYGEIKRMYVRPEFRGRGYAKQMLKHLEELATTRGFSKVRLETGISQPEAIGLYERNGYYKIPPFGDYWDDPLSFFYEKGLDLWFDITNSDENIRKFQLSGVMPLSPLPRWERARVRVNLLPPYAK